MNTKAPSRTAKWLAYGTLAFGSAVVISTTSQPTLAANACRDIDSVKESADLSKNTEMGGHVTQHVLGMDPPKGTSQNEKTLFKDGEKFRRIWNKYNGIPNPKYCAGNQNIQQVFRIDGFVDALSCREADDKGRCTAYDSYAADTIAVAFVKNGTKWILNTAYPVPMK